MPLPVGAAPFVPPQPLTGPVIWTNTPVGTMRATWVDPEGTRWSLSDTSDNSGWFTRPQIAGWGAAPHTIVSDPLPRGGVSVRFQRREPRRLNWPLHIWGDVHMEWLVRYRMLMRAFTLTKYRGPGTLIIERPDGSSRAIDCLLEDGFGGESGENWKSANPPLILFCPDGYWRDTVEQVESRSYVAPGGRSFLGRYPRISTSRVLGETTIVNGGDIETYPNWVITGPATEFTATNVTTDESFTLTTTLLAGEQATITITPTRAMLRGPAGENLADDLNFPGAVLWALLPGTNKVNFQVSGSGTGTKVRLSYYRRYETA